MTIHLAACANTILRKARLSYAARYVPAADDTVDAQIDFYPENVGQPSPVSIQLAQAGYVANREISETEILFLPARRTFRAAMADAVELLKRKS